MFKSIASTSSGGFGGRGSSELSEYERQRLKNISELNEQLSGLIECVQNSAVDLAKASSISDATSSNDRKHKPKSQPHSQSQPRSQYGRKVKQKPIEKPCLLQGTRRSKRLINGERKKPDYNEQSDDE